MFQILKTLIPENKLYDLLDKLCEKNIDSYIFNLYSYKKGILLNLIQTFLEECKPFYHISKQFYLTKHLTYNSFITVLRQICKSNNIKYTSKIKYDKSVYEIIYYVLQKNQITDGS